MLTHSVLIQRAWGRKGSAKIGRRGTPSKCELYVHSGMFVFNPGSVPCGNFLMSQCVP